MKQRELKIGHMTHTPRPQSKAVAAGTAAGLRHLERVYVAKVNAALADDRDDLAQELARDHRSELTKSARVARAARATQPVDCEPQRGLRRPRWFRR